MKKLIVRPGLFLKKDEEKAIINKIKKAWKEDNFVVIPPGFSYEVVDDNVDLLKQAREEIQKLRGCSCSCSDGIIDDVEDILDKLIESEGVND